MLLSYAFPLPGGKFSDVTVWTRKVNRGGPLRYWPAVPKLQIDMGISGLLPLLKSIQKPCNIKKFTGQTIGVDAYGWLHRGTVACSIDLALGKPTTKYVDFSMHRVRMLIHFGITPYLVFDGDFLPSKAATEVDRAKKREESKRKGLELYHLDKPSHAQNELQKAVDVTPAMARQLIDELKKEGVQYVVAPYEADAQLVYLEKKGMIHGILSEDSDLLVFGAQKLLTKLDQYGDCVEINRADFTACREVSLAGWSDAEFRRMAILSGCDYLASINKMGLKSAYRYVRKYKTIEKILQMLAFDGQYHIPQGYLERFHKAELTFLHQRVFCPLLNEVVMMTEVADGLQPRDLSFVGADVSKDIAMGVANGDLDPMTKQPIYVKTAPKITPKTPWNSSRKFNVSAISDAKENKSTDSFFKVKRTPLAELDCNSFNSSPTQQRLLQRASGASWNSSPAPASSPGSETNFLLPPSSGHPSWLAKMSTSTSSVDNASAGVQPQKRRRLCLYPDDTSTLDCAKPERSRYFAANAVDASLQTRKSAKSKSKCHDITIWSDDSIEDAMAELPNDYASANPSSKGGTSSPIDDKRKKVEEPVCTEIQGKHDERGDSQRSTVSEAAKISQVPSKTNLNSVPTSECSVTETLDKHVTNDLKTLAGSCAYQPETNKMALQRDEIEKSIKRKDVDFAERILSKPQLQRQRSMTPLQRLGVGALKSSPSFNGLLNNLQPYKKEIVGPPASKSMDETPVRVPSLPKNSTFGPDASVTRGSEDYLIPDSEDSGDDSQSEVEGRTRPSIDLGRFAFLG